MFILRFNLQNSILSKGDTAQQQAELLEGLGKPVAETRAIESLKLRTNYSNHTISSICLLVHYYWLITERSGGGWTTSRSCTLINTAVLYVCVYTHTHTYMAATEKPVTYYSSSRSQLGSIFFVETFWITQSSGLSGPALCTILLLSQDYPTKL